MHDLVQTPPPGATLVFTRGDVVTFTLEAPGAADGTAWLRTNLGRNSVRLAEIIERVEKDAPELAHDWHDLPMSRDAGGRFTLTLPLSEVGRFEAKTCVINDALADPIWPHGPNTIIKVQPACAAGANTIYCAFVRQFGPNKQEGSVLPDHAQCIDNLESAGYTVIPRSGTFRDLIAELDFIIGELGFRILQLLPIHPVPTTYARMGRFGSPFAVLDLCDVDPTMADFDRRTTPLEQFGELVDATHSHGARLFLDIPINHTGWASALQIHHPEWFRRGSGHTFHSPGAWGVTWEDLSELDYRHRGLWLHMAEVFLFWCRKGVDGFRCDAGYMVPAPVWRYIVARVREEYPETVFLLEGLGGRLEVTQRLLIDANLDWAYSELFQNYSRDEVRHYLPSSIAVSESHGLLVHFAETHDNNRLAATGQAWSRMRCALTSLCSHNGAFGITNGVEWFADKKFDVHGAPSLSWGATPNQVDFLSRLTRILSEHPAFHAGTPLKMVETDAPQTIALRRGTEPESLLVLANLGTKRADTVRWAAADWDAESDTATDLLTGDSIPLESDNGRLAIRLAPAAVVCLSSRSTDLALLEPTPSLPGPAPAVWVRQLAIAKAQQILTELRGLHHLADWDGAEAAARILADPTGYCDALAAPARFPRVSWHYPRDMRRTVMVPPGHFVCVSAPHPFELHLCDGPVTRRHEVALPNGDCGFLAIVAPLAAPRQSRELLLRLCIHGQPRTRHEQTGILYLAAWDHAMVRNCLTRDQAVADDLHALCTNGRGAMSHVRLRWGEIRSQYDCLLGANLHPEFPVDRCIILTRCRAWIRYKAYSQEINHDCLVAVCQTADGRLSWRFRVPTGMGKVIPLQIDLGLARGVNRSEIAVHRPRIADVAASAPWLEDTEPVRLIVRPDIEWRSFHEKTLAYQGPEHRFPAAVQARHAGFSFRPGGEYALEMDTDTGRFHPDAQWQYHLGHPIEAERGLRDASDLFSPGYFTADLPDGTAAVFSATAVRSGEAHAPPEPGAPLHRIADSADGASEPLLAVMRRAMRQFVVARGPFRTVIAGYPWFLDWGRDTLICLRGLIAAGFHAESRTIIQQFARFEENGTLPNMIRGDDCSNRDTTDAPLWLFVAAADLMQAEASRDLLDTDCGGRPLLAALKSIADGYINGTPNGIRMDPESGLVFSPSHFTWMDTNHPAGTPRAGYPVEIQALWYAALRLLADCDDDARWAALAEQVQASIIRHFRDDAIGLADCLHCEPGVAAAGAVRDDALRSNQLLAVTLGAIHDRELQRRIVAATEELLVPGGIRSLADRAVTVPLQVRGRHGHLLNDPSHPYWGHYRGDEDTRRKPAYHNGTAWTWPFPSYPEALLIAWGDGVAAAALSLLGSSTLLTDSGCIGQIPEILDGDRPHFQRGCGAQAWGVTELYRVAALLLDRIDGA